MRRKEDVAFACALGVDALGFIFYEKSQRALTLEAGQALLKDLPPFVTAVAVLVNPEKEFVHTLLKCLPIQLLQFHGEESPEFCAQFQMPYVKALPAQSTSQIQEATKAYAMAQGLLLDTPCSTLKGGTGMSFDWGMVPQNTSMPFILAGGLNAQNVLEAADTVRPYALDVNSGVESAPGVKDKRKMSELVHLLRGKKG
jgi:phosphoribosylanthranilate isomerase